MADSRERIAPGFKDKWDGKLFDLDNIKKLVGQELSELEISTELPTSFVVVALEGSRVASTLGREVEKTVFEQYFGNDLALLRSEYEAYDEHSVFIVALDVINQAPAGAVRLILPSITGLKSLNDIADPSLSWQLPVSDLAARMQAPAFSPPGTLDIATLAVKKEYRSEDATQLDRISALLYYAMYQWSRSHGYEQWVGILDTRPLEAIQKLGAPLDFFEGVEAAPYLDSSSSIPFYANLDRIDVRLEAVGLADFFVRGQGVDPTVMVKL